MITADTITDEQIRELHDEAGHADALGIVDLCDAALAPFPRSSDVNADLVLARRQRARARCAEILNQRGGAK